jgi:hypothetical protein
MSPPVSRIRQRDARGYQGRATNPVGKGGNGPYASHLFRDLQTPLNYPGNEHATRKIDQ